VAGKALMLESYHAVKDPASPWTHSQRRAHSAFSLQ
jgi:hypothetical protein